MSYHAIMMIVPRLAVLSTALAMCTMGLSAAPMPAMISEVTGVAEFADPGSTDFKPLVKGATLPSGSIIRTGPDGVVLFVPVRGAAMRVAPNTELTVSNMDFAIDGSQVTLRKAEIDLTSGLVSAVLDEKISPDVTDFKIRTPDGVAIARGTFYSVCVHDNKSYVKVKSGKVGVQSKVTSPIGQPSYLPAPGSLPNG
jgi:hypothetical protein